MKWIVSLTTFTFAIILCVDLVPTSLLAFSVAYSYLPASNNNNNNNYVNSFSNRRQQLRWSYRRQSQNRNINIPFVPSNTNRNWIRSSRCFLKHDTSTEVAPIQSTSTTISTNNDDDKSSIHENIIPTDERWLKRGILISSFTDGLQSNEAAKEYLSNEIQQNLLEEYKNKIEQSMIESVLFSPCNGPNISLWNEMEQIDTILEQYNNNNNNDTISSSVENKQQDEQKLKLGPLRVVFIPTAMYALRYESNNTPGKQRQRARVDAKQRRDAIVQLLQEILVNTTTIPSIEVVTLDLDDGSIKQPQQITLFPLDGEKNVNNYNTDKKKSNNDLANFPQTGKDALGQWKPHLLYVLGGNTFWLYHCIEKGQWANDITDLVTGTIPTKDNSNNHTALYIGASAGAIVAGAAVETACWKGWDDPRIVPNRESYSDWTNITGLQLLGSLNAIFPHYDKDLWDGTVRTKQQELQQTRNKNVTIWCIHDTEAYLIDGVRQKYKIVTSSSTTS